MTPVLRTSVGGPARVFLANGIKDAGMEVLPEDMAIGEPHAPDPRVVARRPAVDGHLRPSGLEPHDISRLELPGVRHARSVQRGRTVPGMAEHEWEPRISAPPPPGSKLPANGRPASLDWCRLCGAVSVSWSGRRYLLETGLSHEQPGMTECPDTCEEAAVLLVMRQ